jgi:four helix bundle protein
MFLQLAHTKLDVFQYSRALTLECYRQTKNFPQEERYAMTTQIRRAVLSVHLNIAEGCSRKSFGERKRFFEVSRGSLIEVDTAFDIALALGYCSGEELKTLGETLIRVFKVLSGLIGHEATTHH